jgi:CDP-glucose 4,6-dehydratase
VLDAFKESPSAKLLIVITTDKVYDNVEWDWGYRENDRLGGKDIYSASKAAAEIITDAFRHSFFRNSDKMVVTVRAGNVIGGGDWSPNRIIPDCIRSIENGEPIIVRNPLSVRPWQHVLEPLNGYLLLGAKLLSGERGLIGAWNFGPLPGNVTAVENLVQEIISCFGKGKYTVQKNEHALYESKILTLDISKALHQLKWSPKLHMHDTIKYTIEWYKNYTDADVYDLCRDQIQRYMNL